MTREIDMINGGIVKKIIAFTIPIMLQGILQSLYNSADLVIVGRFAGDAALSSVGATTHIYNAMLALFLGIVAGVGAKELVVSTLGVMYSGEDLSVSADSAIDPEMAVANAGSASVEIESAGETRLQKALLKSVTPAGALAYMVFILLYVPCVATFVSIRNESGSWKWAILTAVYTIFLAWTAAFITFRVASLLMGL